MTTFKQFLLEETDRPVTRDDFTVEGPTEGMWFVSIKHEDEENGRIDKIDKEKYHWQIEAMRSFIRSSIDQYDDEAQLAVYSPTWNNTKAIGLPVTKWHHIPDIPTHAILKPSNAIIAMAGDGLSQKFLERIAVKMKPQIESLIERNLALAIELANDSRKHWNNPLDD